MERSTRSTSRSPTEILKAISGFLAVAAAVAEYFKDPIRALFRWSPVALPDVAATWMATTLVVSGVLLVWQALRPRSRLLRPEALTIMPGCPEHLVGRSEDLEQLKRACTGNRLVFLIGESGSGKTALLRAGLMPSAPQTFLPVYVDTWGEDWESGAWHALAIALSASITPEDRQSLGDLSQFSTPGLAEYLRRAQAATGKRPLFILDQFDDYVSLHLSALLSEQIWISASSLQSANSFWRALADVIRAGAAHAIVTTRADAAACLDSVRFVDVPVRFNLDRLRDSFIEPFLVRLTTAASPADNVISHPEAGWVALRSRLARDLSKNGVVLAAQMRLAFAGLDTLNPLSVSSFERIGGIRGIEAAHLRRHLGEAARIAGLAETTLLAVMLQMVDQPRGKTTPRSLSELAGGTGASPGEPGPERSIDTALQHLIRKYIIRRIPDPLRETALYALAHDYLSGAVVDVHRGTNRWQRVLAEGHDAFDTASGSVWRQWKAMLPPTQSIAVAAQRMRGRLRYDQSKWYALLSVLRFAPVAAVVALVGFVSIDRRKVINEAETYITAIEQEAAAQRIVIALGRDPAPLTDAERSAIWEIAYSSEARDAFLMKVAFLRHVMSSSESAAKFLGRRSHLLTALWGADAALADEICRHACWPRGSYDAENPAFIHLQAIVGSALPEFNGVLFDSIVDNVRFQDPEDSQVVKFAKDVATFAERSDAPHARLAYDRLISKMTQRQGALNSGDGAFLAALVRRMREADARGVWEQMRPTLLADAAKGRAGDRQAAGPGVAVLLAAASMANRDLIPRTLDEVMAGTAMGDVTRSAPPTRDLIHDAIWRTVAALPLDDQGRYLGTVLQWALNGSPGQTYGTTNFDFAAFFSGAAAVAGRVKPDYADAAIEHCLATRAAMPAPKTSSAPPDDSRVPVVGLRSPCLSALGRYATEATAGAVIQQLLNTGEYEAAINLVGSAPPSVALENIKRARVRNRVYYPEQMLVGLASRLSPSQADELLSDSRARKDSAAAAIRRADYDRGWIQGMLIARARTVTDDDLKGLITEGGTAYGNRKLAYALALSGHVSQITDVQVSSVFEFLEGTLLADRHLTQVSFQFGGSAVVTEPVVGALMKLGGRLAPPQARAALERWFGALEAASAEEVAQFGPLLQALVRPGDAQLVFDLAKRPDFNAMNGMQEALLRAFAKLVPYEGTGMWPAAGAAKRRQLDPVSAPPRDWEYVMRQLPTTGAPGPGS